MNCVIYVRVSDQQQTRGSSLADQERACREFARRQGLKVLRVYRDEGRSAYKDDLRHRPQFAAMLAAAGAFNAVLVYKLDRFARRARIYHTSRWQLEQAGAQLLSATEPNEDTAAGRLSSGMLAQFAEFYSAQLSERIKGAAQSRAARGLWVGPAPFGYVLDPRTHQLVPGAHWIWVVIVFVSYDLGHTTTTIAAALRAAGVPLASGKPWSKDSVLGVLRNHAYIGRAGGRALAAYDAGHRPLIGPELWKRVQETLGTRRRRPSGPRRGPRPAPLAYEPHCAACGAKMHRYTSAGGVYLRCWGAANKVCSARGVRLDLIEHQVKLLRASGAAVARVWLAVRGVERFE
jgi:site-specific DNA recombinase